MRVGPGTAFPVVDTMQQDDSFTIMGKNVNAQRELWFLIGVGTNGTQKWVSGNESLVEYWNAGRVTHVVGPTPPPPTSVPVLASNRRDFSSEQGKNGWWYQIEQGRNSGNFTDFPRFGPYQASASEAPRNCWMTGEEHVRICENGEVHPGNTGRIAYRWRSDVARQVHVTLHVHKMDSHCGNNDGVWIGVYRVPQGGRPIKIAEFIRRGADVADWPDNTERYDVTLSAMESLMVMVDIRTSSACDATRMYLDIQ